jgi:hypothetical protein
MQRAVGKSAGDEPAIIPAADRAAVPDAADGKGGHGAARPDSVIHRDRVSLIKTISS